MTLIFFLRITIDEIERVDCVYEVGFDELYKVAYLEWVCDELLQATKVYELSRGHSFCNNLKQI